MRRREFIALLSGATAAWPLVARAQQHAKVHRLATVAPTFSIGDMIETGPLPLFNGLFKQLRQLGYVEGHNLSVDRYSGQGRIESYPELASEVVRSHPDLIFIVTGRLARYFQAVTTTIPLVVNTGNPIAFGLVTSLARPGGNLTGVVVDAGIEIEGKRLQLLREMVPSVSKVAYLAPRVHLESPYGAQVREVAQRMGLSLFGAPLESPIGEPEYRSRRFTRFVPLWKSAVSWPMQWMRRTSAATRPKTLIEFSEEQARAKSLFGSRPSSSCSSILKQPTRSA